MEIGELTTKLEKLQAGMNPTFGIMSPQHMLEHLTITFKLSSGKIKIPNFEPNEKQLAYKDKLLNTPMEFPKGIKAPGLPSELMPLRFQNLEEAKEHFIRGIEEFEKKFEENPNLTTLHPRFGPMSYDDWIKFHKKHIHHHFSQFEL